MKGTYRKLENGSSRKRRTRNSILQVFKLRTETARCRAQFLIKLRVERLRKIIPVRAFAVAILMFLLFFENRSNRIV